MNRAEKFLLEHGVLCSCQEKAELEVLQELDRLDIYNLDRPTVCDRCGHPLAEGSGFAHEDVLFCTNGCGVVWEDAEQAIRNVI